MILQISNFFGSEVVQQIRRFNKFKCLLFMKIMNKECFVYIVSTFLQTFI